MLNDYPIGDGAPDCALCHGRGVIPVPDPQGLIPITQHCRCVAARDRRANVDRGWHGLSGATKISTSPLRGHENEFLYITGTDHGFRAHMRHVALRQASNWDFLVVTDAELMSAWLASSLIEGKEIFDPDANQITAEHFSLADLIEPPALLVVIVGVKAARNAAMPEVLLEAVRLRIHRNKPMWIVDRPGLRLQEGHISYSQDLMQAIAGWAYADLSQAEGGGEDIEPEVLSGRPSTTLSKPTQQTRVSLNPAVPPRTSMSGGTSVSNQGRGPYNQPQEEKKPFNKNRNPKGRE